MNWLENGYTMYGQDADAEHVAYPRVIKSHLPLKVPAPAALPLCSLVQKLTGLCLWWQQCPSGTKKIYVYRDLNDALWSMFPFMTSFLGLVNQVTAEVYAQQRILCVFAPN